MKIKTRAVATTVAVVAILIVSGCTGLGSRNTEMYKQSQPERFTAGDAMRIVIYPDSSSFLNGVYPIDIEGNVFLPIVGKVAVVSLTPGQMVKFLQSTFSMYTRFPEIQVRPLIRVSLLGGFAQPGLYYVEPERSIWDIVHLAGGTTTEDGLRRMKWERDKKIVNPDLIPFIESGESLGRIGFQSGDQIWTPAERGKGIWTVAVREFLIRDVLPLTTFFLSLYVTYLSAND